MKWLNAIRIQVPLNKETDRTLSHLPINLIKLQDSLCVSNVPQYTTKDKPPAMITGIARVVNQMD